MGIKAALYDLDGVLLDSMPFVHKAICAISALSSVLGPNLPKPCKRLRKTWLQYYELVHLLASNKEAQTLYRTFTKTEQIQAYPGAKETLAQLRAKHIPIGIVSARHEASLLQLLMHHGIDQYLHWAIGGANYKAPAMRAFCKNYNFKSREVIYIGDLPTDVRDGQEAGLQTAAFLGDHGHPENFWKHRPDYFFSRHDDILNLI